MDTELARTFLAVAATGNFVAAASRLFVTQSTVSARIHSLETTLGARLFQRGRNGAELTPAGKRFLRHAKHLVRTVEQARHDVGLPQGYSDVLTLSGRIAVWEGFLPHWVAWMREAAPETSLRLEIGFEVDIMQGLIEGTVDIGVMYTPTSRSGLVVEALFDETLVLVGSEKKRAWPDPGYIHVDWGPEFHAQFSEHFAHIGPPALVANIGWLGVQQLLVYGGSGYFPVRLVRHHLEAGRLWRVPDSPAFKLPAWMVYPRDSDNATLKHALEGLRELARAEQAVGG
ncbi:MAG: LysR family transcriptional regulator [Hydrogenophilales bacterium 16-64-46]|nr:MAG: LysR family transcriptional regulator [Hydrogenophilales bacterium 12-64-13]OYZ07144.1 MAG: LysR family transcriptional regulator [Hydrogenophilales bacterium 16-64-46]HQT00594.1 LysR family transcriptional regulator [Thiobacillus sp.]